MAFDAYEQVAAAEFLQLPIGGVTYVIPPVGVKDALRLRLAVDQSIEQFLEAGGDPAAVDAPLTDEEFHAILLSGPVLTSMRDANVPDEAILRAALTALADHQRGRVVAEITWKTGLLPERLAAYMAASGVATNRSTRRAAARTTRSRNSGPTTPKKATAKKTPPRKAPRSPGPA